MRLHVRFGYESKLKRKGSELLHDMLCSKLDSLGEASQKSMADCLPWLIAELSENHVISWVLP
jgi:hypothetical protein